MNYKAKFIGRKKDAIGIHYKIETFVKGKNKEEAELNLYDEYDHIMHLELYLQLRAVKVSYANNDIITTSMAGHLTDQEIKDYFKVGKWFNLGNGEHDNMQQVRKVQIIE